MNCWIFVWSCTNFQHENWGAAEIVGLFFLTYLTVLTVLQCCHLWMKPWNAASAIKTSLPSLYGISLSSLKCCYSFQKVKTLLKSFQCLFEVSVFDGECVHHNAIELVIAFCNFWNFSKIELFRLGFGFAGLFKFFLFRSLTVLGLH